MFAGKNLSRSCPACYASLNNNGQSRNGAGHWDNSGTYAGQLRRSNLSFAGRTGHTPLGVSRLSRSGKNQAWRKVSSRKKGAVMESAARLKDQKMVSWKAVVFFCASLALMGCTTQVNTQVDAYSSIPDDIEPRTVYIAPFRGMSSSDLQWQAHARVLAAVLNEKGFTIAPRQRDARLTAFFGFGIDQGETVQTSYSIPQWGVTGYSGATTTGSVFGSSFRATTTYTPRYGVTGYRSGIATNVVFTRSVAIDMFDNRTRQQVFQARGVSRGSCNSFGPVAEQIIGAVLSNFPAGRTGRVALPMQDDC